MPKPADFSLPGFDGDTFSPTPVPVEVKVRLGSEVSHAGLGVIKWSTD
jgi:hypothetical protein